MWMVRLVTGLYFLSHVKLKILHLVYPDTEFPFSLNPNNKEAEEGMNKITTMQHEPYDENALVDIKLIWFPIVLDAALLHFNIIIFRMLMNQDRMWQGLISKKATVIVISCGLSNQCVSLWIIICSQHLQKYEWDQKQYTFEYGSTMLKMHGKFPSLYFVEGLFYFRQCITFQYHLLYTCY